MEALAALDLEMILPGLVYDALSGRYPRLYTSRSAPADFAARPIVVLHREGGPSKNRLIDQARIVVDVYAGSESVANKLALDARAALEALQGHRPIIEVTATGPSPITDAGKGPQRRFYADVLMRKARS